MVKKGLFLIFFMAIDINAVVKATRIADFELQLDITKPQKKTFINKTGHKILFRYRMVNPKNGDFVAQEPLCLDQDSIAFDLSELGSQILPAGYGKVYLTQDVAKVTQTPEKKMDELCACRFKNGKKDRLVSSYEFNKHDRFELYLDSDGCIRCRILKKGLN